MLKDESMLQELIGLQIFKSWNVFATRIFYFADLSCRNRSQDGDYRLALECPWRIEQYDRILVGSEDYGERATDNLEPDWNRSEMQWGHLQDQNLIALMGREKDHEIYTTNLELVVESVNTDPVGGFHLSLSGGYRLSVFPASSSATFNLEWQLSRRTGGLLTLAKGVLSESREGPAEIK